jgi:hypothetical protein
MSWEATEAVLQLFPRKTKRSQFGAMIVIAHHYNNDLQQSFPGLELIQQKVGCKKRYAIKLLDALGKGKDIFVIEKGRGRGHTTVFGLAPTYTNFIKEMVSSKECTFS